MVSNLKIKRKDQFQIKILSRKIIIKIIIYLPNPNKCCQSYKDPVAGSRNGESIQDK